MEKQTSNLIFHFWGKGLKEDDQFSIFESIASKGLLLTRARDAQVDQFWYFGKDSALWLLTYNQMPRVCFTDAPKRDLSTLQAEFGSFGIGFSVETILRWGAAPVWYIPNYTKEKTQYGKFGEVLSQIGELGKRLQSELAKSSDDQYRSGLQEQLEALQFIMSHFKGTSSNQRDDFKYVPEREWRLVAGFPYGDGATELFRSLEKSEIDELIDSKRGWTRALVKEFLYFNGLNEGDSMAKKIVEVQVPSDTLRRRVQEYIDVNESLFGKGINVAVSKPIEY